MDTAILTAKQVVKQGDRTLIYGHPKYSDYYIIAKSDVQVKAGDTVLYEPYGWNFGWFIKIESAQ